jgi:hypothetical protein
MMEYKSNLAAVINNLKKTDVEMSQALDIGIQQGLEAFRGRIVKRQMSGRPGLNTITGTSKKSWRVRRLAYGAYQLATSSWWLLTHQKGMVIKPKNPDGWLRFKTTGAIRTVSKSGKPLKRATRGEGNWVTVKQVTIPKRLHVLEDYAAHGHKIIRRAMWLRVGEVLRRRAA